MEKKLIDFSKYVGVLLKITKLQDNKFDGEHPAGINEGSVRHGFISLENSNFYQCLFTFRGDRYFHTSQVKRIEEHEGYDLITTLNSVYKVEMDMPAIPGVQQKYSVELENPE